MVDIVGVVRRRKTWRDNLSGCEKKIYHVSRKDKIKPQKDNIGLELEGDSLGDCRSRL